MDSFTSWQAFKALFMVGPAVLLTGTSSFAEAPPPVEDPALPPSMLQRPVMVFPEHTPDEYWLFRPGEFFLDGFAVGAIGKGNHIDTTFGGGAGLGYYFTRHFAIVGEAFGSDLPGGHKATVLGGMHVRFPFDDAAFAVYLLVEGGEFFADRNGGTIQAGGGVDVRLTDKVSLFFDARGMYINNQDLGAGLPPTSRIRESDGAVLMRLGLRILF